MRTVQELFDLAIAHGGYPDVKDYMCSAMAVIKFKGIISVEERDCAWAAIDEYLEPTEHVFLETALHRNGLPSAPSDRLAIYKDWANRPVLEAKV